MITRILLTFTLILPNAFSYIKKTGSPFDILLVGDGYYKVISPKGEVKYTKNSSYIVEKNGLVVDRLGWKLAPGFEIPERTKSVLIHRSGLVEIFKSDVGGGKKIGIVEFFKKDNQGNFFEVESDKDNLEVHQGVVDTAYELNEKR